MDSKDFVKKYDKCQRFTIMPHQPPEQLTTITLPWPFMKWGMDIVGKMSIAPGQRIYMLVLTDYFTKWVKAKAFHQVRDIEVKKQFWKNIICRFGVLNEIVTDNGSQFISFAFQDLCAELNIKLTFSTPRHPQSNVQAESTKKIIVNMLRK